MKKILILGGYGLTGKKLARHLLEQTDVAVIIAGRSLEKGQAFADQLSTKYRGRRVSAIRMDASMRQSLMDGLKGIDLLLVAAPTTQHTATVIRAALDSDVDYLDVQFNAEKLTLLQASRLEIQKAGRCFITEAGFHPGLPSAMIRFAADRIDRPEAARTACFLNMGASMPYSEAVDELMEAFKNYQAQTFKDGKWQKPDSYDTCKFDFGGEIGRRLCYSMFFEELRDLPAMYPSLKDVGFYISGSNLVTDMLITPIVYLGLKLAPTRGVRPMGRLMWWGMQKLSQPPYEVTLIAEVLGVKAGIPVRSSLTVSHPDGYELTAVPVVACLKQYLDGSARKPGLWMMGHLVEPARLFADMERMGMKVEPEIV